MSSGVNLASRPFRSGGPAVVAGWFLVAAALAATGIHLFLFLRAHAAREEMHREVEKKEARFRALEREIRIVRRSLDAPAASSMIRWLLALESSGAIHAVNPSEVLSLLAEALPQGSRILSVKLEAAPPMLELRIEAEAAAPHVAEELLTRLVRSSLVVQTRIEEEIHRGDGQVYLRVRAELSSPGGER